jgi:AMP-binding enzyme
MPAPEVGNVASPDTPARPSTGWLDGVPRHDAAGLRPACRAKRRGEWHEIGWGELWDRAGQAASGFERAGYRGRRVGILGTDSLEWVVSYLGLARCGAICIPLPLLPDLTPVRQWMQAASVEVLACDSFSRLASILGAGDLDLAEAVVWWPDRRVGLSSGVRTLDDLEGTGPSPTAERASSFREVGVGTSGPDGSDRSLADLGAAAEALAAALHDDGRRPVVGLDSLGLSGTRHVVLGLALATGRPLGILEPGGDLETDLRELRPGIVVASARRLDMWAASVVARLGAASGIDRRIVGRWSTSHGLDGATRNAGPGVVGRRLRTRLGLRDCAVVVSHGGPIGLPTRALIRALGIDHGLLHESTFELDRPSDP